MQLTSQIKGSAYRIGGAPRIHLVQKPQTLLRKRKGQRTLTRNWQQRRKLLGASSTGTCRCGSPRASTGCDRTPTILPGSSSPREAPHKFARTRAYDVRVDGIPPSPAHARDEGRSRARRLTWWAAAAATAVTAAGAGIAAVTVPGHTVDAQAQPAPATSGDGSGGGSVGGSGGGSVGGFDPNSGASNPPQPAGGNGPLIISGGS